MSRCFYSVVDVGLGTRPGRVLQGGLRNPTVTDLIRSGKRTLHPLVNVYRPYTVILPWSIEEIRDNMFLTLWVSSLY